MDFVYTEKVISELSRDKILLNYTVDSQMSKQKKFPPYLTLYEATGSTTDETWVVSR